MKLTVLVLLIANLLSYIYAEALLRYNSMPYVRSSSCRLKITRQYKSDSVIATSRATVSRPLQLSLSNVLDLRAGSIPFVWDLGVSSVVLGETLLWLKLWTTLASTGAIESKITRKIIHASCVPLFILHWPLYSVTITASLAASLIPLLQMLRLYLAGSQSGNNGENNELVAAVSRTGKKEEALGGPFIYAIVLFFATMLSFRSSPVGIVAISQMAVGDGLADIFGRRFGSVKWPWDGKKSLVGSLAFVCGGFACSVASLYWMQRTGFLNMEASQYLGQLLLISVLSAAVELAPGGQLLHTLPAERCAAVYD
jgi:dolichol kinase